MKRFKIGFLAVIAVLAMSFTVALQSDPITEPGCYEQVDGISESTPLPAQAENGTQLEAGFACLNENQNFCCFEVREISGQPGEFEVYAVRKGPKQEL